jgi:type VI secretion system secreted protein VgrG
MAIIRDEGGIEFLIRIQDQPEDEFRVVRFDGADALSELFEYELELVSENHEVPFDAIVGKPVALTIRGKLVDDVRQGESHVHGIASRFEQGPIGTRLSTYYLTLVPRFWTLQNRIDTRVFQELTVPQIVKQVFENAGVPASAFRDSLKGSYPAREYCVQYQESDWDFASRLLEEEGIAYFFEQGEDDHVLVLADDVSAFAALPESEDVPFRDPSGQETGEDSITDFRFSQAVRTGAVLLRDYNFTRPQTNLDARSQAAADSDLASYEFPGRYQVAAEGNRLARVRLEEQQATRRVARGVGSVRRFASGRRFTLKGHARADRNKSYLLTRVEHHGYEPQALERDAPVPTGDQGEPKYRNDFQCIPAEVPFRPARATPRPCIRGTQSAVVVGPSGEEIYTDEYGRVKVHFHWDRHGEADETCSCWIRVSQSWAGGGWGSSYIPRIGQEVLVSFLDGDPDRPYLVGSLYNNSQMPPYDLPAQKTKSTLKSASSPGSGGFNELRFEDKAGEEQIYLHAQKALEVKVLEDRLEQVERDSHLIVRRDQLESIENERHTKIGSDDVTEICKDQHLAVSGKQATQISGSQSVKVSGAVAEEYGQNHSEQVAMKYYLKAMAATIESSTGITLKCGGSSVVIDPTGVTFKGAMLVLDGSLVRIASGPGSPPQPGQAGQLISPIAPRQPYEVDDPDPGTAAANRAEQVRTRQGRYGSASVAAFRPPQSGDEEETTWVEIELLDDQGSPIAGERYEISLPDGTVFRGTLDENGRAHVAGIEPGTCRVTFPDLDRTSWE